MQDNIKNKLIRKISEMSKKIRGVEDFSKKVGVSTDSDVYYASLRSYKAALEDILHSIKE